MVVALVLLSVSLTTALAFWWEKVGVWGFGVIGAAALAALLAVIVMPETAWQRLTGTLETAELGRLHEEGIAIQNGLPWVRDDEGKDELDAHTERAEAWENRVYQELPPRWRGVFRTRVLRTTFSVDYYGRAGRLRNWMDDRLERLSQIMTALGRGE